MEETQSNQSSITDSSSHSENNSESATPPLNLPPTNAAPTPVPAHSYSHLSLPELRSQHTRAFSEKEEFNKKRREITAQIRAHIAAVKQHKEARTEKNKKVRELKLRREELHTKIKSLIQEVTVLGKQRDDAKKKVRGEDPSSLLREMQHLETKLETEALPFNKEKELSKKIKDLRKQYDEQAAVVSVFDAYGKKNNELRECKREAQKVHNEIQILAKESEHHHQEIIALSKKVDELKVHEEECAQKFKEKRKEWTELEYALTRALGAAEREWVKAQEVRKKHKELKVQKQKESILRRRDVVEQKMREGKTLTNEDILILQASDQEEHTDENNSGSSEDQPTIKKKDH